MTKVPRTPSPAHMELTVRGEKLCTHDPGTQEGLPNMFGDTFETFEISVP